MNREFLEPFLKIRGAEYNSKRRRLHVPLDNNGGNLTTVFFSPYVMVQRIEIHSHTIPDFSSTIDETCYLKINYCQSGRCELSLNNGERTYLSGGELAVDTGQATDSFYYPNAEYTGIEIFVFLDSDWRNDLTLLGESVEIPNLLAESCRKYSRPQIIQTDDEIKSIAESIDSLIEAQAEYARVYLKFLELLFALGNKDFGNGKQKRSFYTSTQAEIAKKVYDKISNNLDIRYTAKELAVEFGVSETSLKTYFRGVYGCGYAEFQQNLRLRRAADLLAKTDKKVIDIALSVGYKSQPKFGAAFKERYKVSPLEYRRRCKFENKTEGDRNVLDKR